MDKQKIDRAHKLLIGSPFTGPAFLERFIGTSQRMAMRSVLQGEEGEDMADKIIALVEKINAAPVTYQQDGKGDAAVVHFHYFMGGMDFHITELDMEDKVSQAFGLANLGDGGELGYISITELIQNGVELDLYWSEKTLGEVRKGR